ncbi:MAG TPA: hypothetical protein VMF32_06445 [Xanthobacteraceae bacterium]|nr:hypothetical protein [Xanthobacteraceae bacterium]
MWKQILNALAIAIVIASISAAPTTDATLSAARVHKPSDFLSLTHREKRLAWRDLHNQAAHHYGRPWFATIDRWIVPPRITLKRVTHRAARNVPALAGYDFAIDKGRLLIVNPTDHAIAEVIAPQRHFG